MDASTSRPDGSTASTATSAALPAASFSGATTNARWRGRNLEIQKLLAGLAVAVDRLGQGEIDARRHDHRHVDVAVRGRDHGPELLVPDFHRDPGARVGVKGRTGSGTQPHRQGPAQNQRIVREIGDQNR